jgi:hypothetical protein
MRSYSYTGRRSYAKVGIIVIMIIAVVYYVNVGVKCMKHFQSLMDNRTTTINMVVGGD